MNSSQDFVSVSVPGWVTRSSSAVHSTRVTRWVCLTLDWPGSRLCGPEGCLPTSQFLSSFLYFFLLFPLLSFQGLNYGRMVLKRPARADQLTRESKPSDRSPNNDKSHTHTEAGEHRPTTHTHTHTQCNSSNLPLTHTHTHMLTILK